MSSSVAYNIFMLQYIECLMCNKEVNSVDLGIIVKCNEFEELCRQYSKQKISRRQAAQLKRKLDDVLYFIKKSDVENREELFNKYKSLYEKIFEKT